MRTPLTFLTCLALSVIQLIYAQSIHVVSKLRPHSFLDFANIWFQVKVGDTGSFYDPQVTTARAGDLVSFQWTGT